MATYTDGKITYTVAIETSEALQESRRIQKELKTLSDSGDKASKGIDKLEKSAANAGNSLGKLTTIAKAVSAALVSSKIISYAESWNELEDRIANTGLTASQTKDTLNALLETSNRNGRAIEESAELYIRLSNSMKELGYSSNETTTYIGSMSDLFTINQTKAMGAEAAINALTKAQMKGKLSGIEAMTVFSNMPSVLGTLVNHFKKTANSEEKAKEINEQYIRQLANEGKLSIQEFTNALIDSNTELDALADNMRNKTSDALNRIENNLKHYLGELNNATGGTKLLVDSLILVSENVNVLVTGLGILAAVYAGKYITSLLAVTKQKGIDVKATISQAKAEAALAKEAIAKTKSDLQDLQVQKQNIILGQAHANSLRSQKVLAEQLTAVETKITAATNAHTAAQLRLNAAMKASSVTVNVLKSGLNLLGGPMGLLFLVAGGIASLAMSADGASPSMRDYAKSIDEINKSLEGLNEKQLKGKIATLKDEVKLFENEIKDLSQQARNLESALKIQTDVSLWGVDGQNLSFAKSFGSVEEITNKLDKLYAQIDTKEQNLKNTQDELSISNEQLASSTDKITESTERMVKGWEDATNKDIAKKITDLAKELDVATLKADKNAEAAYVLNGLYSSLGSAADEYRDDLIKLAQGQTDFTKLSATHAEELKVLVNQYQQLFKSQKDGKGSTSDYEKEVENLKDKIAVARLESKGLTAEAKLLEEAQKLGISTTSKQAQALRELIQEQANLKLSQSGQAFAGQEVYNNKSQLEQIDIDEQAKLDKLTQWYQAEQQLAATSNETMIEQERLFQEAKTAIVEDANKKREDLQRQSTQAILSASGDLFSGLSDLVGEFSNESGAAYKALFAVSKGFAIANAALNLQTAISNASTLAYPANIGVMAQAAAAGAQIASSISSLSYGGGRKNGGDTSDNSFYRVGEDDKPEILLQGGKQYLLPGENGRVLSNREITSGSNSSGSSISLTINAPFSVDGGSMTEDDGKQLAKNIEQAIRAQIQKEQRPGGLLNKR